MLDSKRLTNDIDAINRVIEQRSAEKGGTRHMEAVRRHVRELEAKRDLLIKVRDLLAHPDLPVATAPVLTDDMTDEQMSAALAGSNHFGG